MMFRHAKAVVKAINSHVQPGCRVVQAGWMGSVEPGHIYVVVSGLQGDEPNDNGDFFQWDELLSLRTDGIPVYATWKDKPNCVNHDLEIVVGTIMDVEPVRGEKSIDMLAKTRRGAFRVAGHDLCKMIESEKINSVSMGCLVQWSECSECGNIARTEDDWCDHLRYSKGQYHNGKMIYEKNHGVYGQELSWICMGLAADPKAKLRKVLAK